MRRTLLTLLRLGIGAGLLFFLVKSGIIDFRSLARLIPAWPLTVAALALLLLDLVLMAWRLCCLFRARELRLDWNDAFRLTALSSFFATFLPGRAGGDLAKIFYASKGNAGRRTEIVTILLFDRLTGLFSLLLAPLLLAPCFPELLRMRALRVGLAVVAGLALAMLTAFFISILLPAAAGRWAALPGRFQAQREIVLRSAQTVAGYRNHPSALLGALGISLADSLLSIAVLALALLVVNPASVSVKLFVVVPIGQVINSLPLTPGGLGVGEAAFHGLFHAAGLEGGAEALLCWRIWNLLIGLLGLIFYVRGFGAQIGAIPPGAGVPGGSAGDGNNFRSNS